MAAKKEVVFQYNNDSEHYAVDEQYVIGQIFGPLDFSTAIIYSCNSSVLLPPHCNKQLIGGFKQNGNKLYGKLRRRCVDGKISAENCKVVEFSDITFIKTNKEPYTFWLMTTTLSCDGVVFFTWAK